MIVNLEIEIESSQIVEKAIRHEIEGLANGEQDQTTIDFTVKCIQELCPNRVEDWEEYIANEARWDTDIQGYIQATVVEAVKNGATFENLDIIG